MALPEQLRGLRVPVVAAPMFLTSGPDLVVECCRSGVLGTFPALNARTTEGLAGWLDQIGGRLAGQPGAAPFGVNLIVHRSNPRLAADLDLVVARQVPVVITSLGAVPELVARVQAYGGLVFHDVINARHAAKAAGAGVDGIVCVAAGAGGHAGTLSPFAILPEIRRVFSGTLLLSGAMATGAQVAAARLMGADLAYIGTRFLATNEAMVPAAQKEMTVAAGAGDIVYTDAISGVAANFLRPSLLAAGLNPETLAAHGGLDMAGEAKVWKTLWSAGQGVAAIDDCPGAAALCDRLVAEYRAAMAAAAHDPFLTERCPA